MHSEHTQLYPGAIQKIYRSAADVSKNRANDRFQAETREKRKVKSSFAKATADKSAKLCRCATIVNAGEASTIKFSKSGFGCWLLVACFWLKATAKNTKPGTKKKSSLQYWTNLRV